MKLAKQVNPGLDLVVEIADISSDGVADRLVGLMARKWDRVDYALNVAGKYTTTVLGKLPVGLSWVKSRWLLSLV